MLLLDWRLRERLSRAEVASRLGVTSEAIRKYELLIGHPERRIPTEEIMTAIAVMTNGEVMPNDFYGVGDLALKSTEAAE